MSRGIVLLLLVVICVVAKTKAADSLESHHQQQHSDDYPDYQVGVKYDEYPMIVPKKRTALLVNRLMVALKEAMEDEEREEALKDNDNLERLSSRSNTKNYALSPEDIRSMDLQRRGHGNMGQQKGRMYWRCYFNAVTCF